MPKEVVHSTTAFLLATAARTALMVVVAVALDFSFAEFNRHHWLFSVTLLCPAFIWCARLFGKVTFAYLVAAIFVLFMLVDLAVLLGQTLSS